MKRIMMKTGNVWLVSNKVVRSIPPDPFLSVFPI